MRGSRLGVAVAVAAVILLSPIGSARWSVFGSHEPDTTLDTPDFMWADPGPASANRVYFNSWPTVFGLANPNVGALGTSIETPTLESHEAMLGVWVDCNGDGYVGMAETALREYRTELLQDQSRCPEVRGTPNRWTPGAHNYNGWVSELVPIAGPHDAGDAGNDARLYRDPDARVWGDYGRPTDSTEVSGGGTCALTPFPRGTWSSTGGLINYADCSTGTMEAWNILWSTQAGDPLGLAFEDDDDARGSALDIGTFGSDDSSHAAVTVVDCDGQPMLHSGDVLNDTPVGPSAPTWAQNTTVPALSPTVGNTQDPTLPGQYNATQEEINGDCDTSNDRGADFYGTLNEGDFNSNPVEGKHEADWNFNFFEGSRGALPWNLAPSGSSGPAGTTNYYGIYNNGGSGWTSPSTLIKTTGPNTVAVRAGLNTTDPTSSNPTVGFAGAYWLTFYAYVGPSVTSSFLTPGGTGIYAGPQCGDADEGIVNGWDCDPTHWNTNPDGTFLPEQELLAFPGDAYNLRDVDCYDGGTDLGLGAGLPAYGDAPCPRP